MNIPARTNTSSRFLIALGGLLRAALLLTLLPIMTESSMAGGDQAPPQTVVPPASKPQRIVSICLQGDQLLLQLVPRERILALSTLATDPDISAHWEAARGIPVTHGGAEEFIRLKPDLVLVSSNSTLLIVPLLKRLGIPVLELGIPTNFDELREQIQQAGRSLGEEAKAEEIVRTMDARLERLQARRPPVAQRPSALFYFQDQFTPGANTFPNAILEAAGFRNLASSFSPGVGVTASMETIIMARPRYLILAHFRDASPTRTQLCETQPLFCQLGADTKVISVSFRDLISPDPSNVELSEMLQERLYK